uniref:Uncharacterized protein n=1 Tax=Grammatophora oceanica TaxID=210454 RepID=A0A7S1VNI5_9STRA
MGKRVRSAVPKDEYALWLHELAKECQYCTQYLTRVAFIVDDIYFAFRTPELFSYRYFTHPTSGRQLRPDVLVLGKGVAAGYPLSMVVAKRGYLNTYDKKFLLQINKTVGTLAAWHGGLVASNCFLEALRGQLPLQISVQDQLTSMANRFESFATNLNERFEEAKLPLRIRQFANTFSVDYLSSSLYNSRYPQYLMAEGIYLGNYSTGKFNLTADATEKDLEELATKFVAAGQRMMEDGYFEANRRRMSLLLGLAGRFTYNVLRLYYNQMMEDKRVDIEVSHNHPVNKWAHFWSSVFMLLYAYPWCFTGKPVEGCIAFLLTHIVRQSGHFFYERQDRDIEKLKFGHKDSSKKGAVVFLALAFCGYGIFRKQIEDALGLNLGTGEYFSLMALFTIIPHYVEITHQYGWLRGAEWMIKILTDPITDLIDFHPYWVIHPRWFLNFKEHKATYKLNPETKRITKVE